MLNDYYQNIGMKGFIQRYGIVNAVKRGAFMFIKLHLHYEDFQRLIAEKGFEYCLKKYGSMKRLEKIRRALSPVKQRLKIMIRH